MTARSIAVFLLGLSTMPRAEGLIFPQLGAEYDRSQNNIEMKEAWSKGHAVGFMHGMSGVAIAPHWFVTAAHLANTRPRVFDCPEGSYKILEMAPLVGDVMLCRVDFPFRNYSRLSASPLRKGDLLRVYGRSSAHWAGRPFRSKDGAVRGWTFGSEVRESMALRWGLARVDFAEDWSFSWPFTALDPELGTNCAGAARMDSGGGIFLGGDLAGLLISGTQPVRARVDPETSLSRDCPAVFLFDPVNLFNCNVPSALLSNAVSHTSAMPLGPNLDRIYRRIAPAQRIHAGPVEIDDWASWTGGYPLVAFPFNAAETNGLAAPPQVYRTAVFAQGTNFLTYPATNLLTTERYTLRLHFGPIPFLEPGEVQQDVYINGINRASRFDPVRESGPERKPVVLEIRGLEPEEGSRASITLIGVGTKRLAYLSGLELTLERR